MKEYIAAVISAAELEPANRKFFLPIASGFTECSTRLWSILQGVGYCIPLHFILHPKNLIKIHKVYNGLNFISWFERKDLI